MSHRQCLNCGYRVTALRAPTSCPRCLVRGRGRFELVPTSIFAKGVTIESDAAERGAAVLPEEERYVTLPVELGSRTPTEKKSISEGVDVSSTDFHSR
jgi:hypothetical protein